VTLSTSPNSASGTSKCSLSTKATWLQTKVPDQSRQASDPAAAAAGCTKPSKRRRTEIDEHLMATDPSMRKPDRIHLARNPWTPRRSPSRPFEFLSRLARNSACSRKVAHSTSLSPASAAAFQRGSRPRYPAR
jgi:hypothetical protein